MSAFLTPCILQIADDTDDGRFFLKEPLQYQSDLAKRVIIVPAGFTTDLASVPRLPLVYWLTGATSNEAAVVHDWLYSSHETDRATADAILKEASEVTKVPAWRRWMMWAGVRAFGGSHWEPKPASDVLTGSTNWEG